jgi:hypothetical protein
MTYHYSHNYQPVGPVSEEQLKELFLKGVITHDTPVLLEGATQWTPYRTLDSALKNSLTTLATPLAGLGVPPPPPPPPPPMPPPPGPPPPIRPSVSAVASQPPKPDYKRLVLVSWILLVAIASISVIPVIGFATWLIALPVFITTLILGVLTLARDGTRDGVLILIATFIAVPLFITIAPLITTSIVGAIADSGSSDHSTASTSSLPPSSSKAQTSGLKVGDTFTLGGFSYTITKASKAISDGQGHIVDASMLSALAPGVEDFYAGSSDSGVIVVVQYKIKNVGIESEVVSTSDFKVRDSKGRTFNPSSDATTALQEDRDFLLTELQPGISRDGVQAFEVPKESLDGSLTLIVPEKGFFSSGEKQVKLGL